jgi:hypothetical protein
MSSSAVGSVAPSDDRTPVERILAAVADAEGVSETDLRPLYGAVDPDALAGVLASGPRTTVVFEFEGYEVTVRGTGRVTLGD